MYLAFGRAPFGSGYPAYVVQPSIPHATLVNGKW